MKKPMKIFLVVTCIGFFLLSAFVGLLFYGAFVTDNKYTGQDLFDAVNTYRASKNIPALEMNPLLCDNLVDRYLSIKNSGKGHEGFEEWLKQEGIQEKGFGQIGELYVTASTPENAVAWWESSPGHRSTLETPTLTQGCAYALDGLGVLILAEKL